MEFKYTVEEVAQRLKVSKKTILREIKRGKLATQKVGRRHLISEAALDSYLTASAPVEGHESSILSPKQGAERKNINIPSEHAFQRENDHNCGPSVLEIVYKRKRLNIEVSDILKDFNYPSKGQVSYSPQLARHLLNHGLRTNLIVSNSQFISPAWKNLPRQELMENLKNWLTLQPRHDWHLYGLHTLNYLEDGGSVELRSIDSVYFEKLIDRGSVLILCVDEVLLWGHRFLEEKAEVDDLQGKTWGHFIVVTKYSGDKFTVLDPYPTGLEGREGQYEVDGIDLVNATLAWSATVLEVME